MIPNRFETVVLPTRAGKSRHVHAPGDGKPLCVDEGKPGGRSQFDYMVKPASAIPDGYYPECDYCLEVIDDTD